MGSHQSVALSEGVDKAAGATSYTDGHKAQTGRSKVPIASKCLKAMKTYGHANRLCNVDHSLCQNDIKLFKLVEAFNHLCRGHKISAEGITVILVASVHKHLHNKFPSPTQRRRSSHGSLRGCRSGYSIRKSRVTSCLRRNLERRKCWKLQQDQYRSTFTT